MNLILPLIASTPSRSHTCAAGFAFGAGVGMGQVLAAAQAGAPPGALMSTEAS